ncbi:MAG: hypothetical protein ACTSYZ_06645 [Candidatus Helarchaeota archaeon]
MECGINELIESRAEELGISKEIIIILEKVVFIKDLKKELEEKEKKIRNYISKNLTQPISVDFEKR